MKERRYDQGTTTTTTRIGSLFSGIGGLDLATEAVFGGRVVWQSENDPYACHVLQRWWPDVPNLGDIEAVQHFPAAEVLCGGFPCQDISSAGTGQGLRGRRSGLWFEFARAVRATAPKFVVVENVGRLRSRGLDQVLADLAEAGFDAEWASVRAADVGAPHRRERMFILGYSDRGLVRSLAQRLGLGPGSSQHWSVQAQRGRQLVADSVRQRCSGLRPSHRPGRRAVASRDQPHRQDARMEGFPPCPESRKAWAQWSNEGRPQPGVRRDSLGPSRGLHARRRRSRLQCLGGSVLPQQAAAALLTLIHQAV